MCELTKQLLLEHILNQLEVMGSFCFNHVFTPSYPPNELFVNTFCEKSYDIVVKYLGAHLTKSNLSHYRVLLEVFEQKMESIGLSYNNGLSLVDFIISAQTISSEKQLNNVLKSVIKSVEPIEGNIVPAPPILNNSKCPLTRINIIYIFSNYVM